MADGVNRIEGWNWQGFMPPQVSTLLLEHRISPNGQSSPVVAKDALPGILVWTDRHTHTWLSLDQREDKRDKVYRLAENEDVLRGDDGDDFDEVYLDWVQWLGAMWKSIESTADPTSCPTTVHKPRLANPHSCDALENKGSGSLDKEGSGAGKTGFALPVE